MIRINRTECPPALRTAAPDSNTYSRPTVVQELWNMQHGKCCYCERRLPVTGSDKHVEHFAPKSIFTQLRNSWPNLLLACPQCNVNKLNKFPVFMESHVDKKSIRFATSPTDAPPALIDPSRVNPEMHLDYHVDLNDVVFGQICARDDSLLGCTTISVTGIGDHYYFKRRRKHIRELYLALIHLDEASDSGNDNLIATHVNRFETLLSSESEFAGLTREFARYMQLDIKYGVEIPKIQ